MPTSSLPGRRSSIRARSCPIADAGNRPPALDRGRRRTVRQVAVYEALVTAGSFVSVRDLHDRPRAAGQRIGFTTVYRALRALAANGGAHVISGRDGRTAYRACGAGHHHHHKNTRNSGPYYFQQRSRQEN